MNWSNIKLIYLRELRDQLRDRRTMFTIAILPLLLYPLMGSAILQVAQFARQHPTRVWVLGAEGLPQDPPLISGDQFIGGDDERRLTLIVEPNVPDDIKSSEQDKATAKKSDTKNAHDGKPKADAPMSPLQRRAQSEIRSGRCDVVVYFPPNFAEELEKFRERLRTRTGDVGDPSESEPSVPAPQIFVNSASEKSLVAQGRVERVLQTWRDTLVKRNLKESSIPAAVTKPFSVDRRDVADLVTRQAALWSKILPFVVLIWALTGAFYPAIDLCAGEKERGTLETLLVSPAQRVEIVWGKLLTIMSFSMATSLLNLASMGFTGMFVMRQAERLGGSPLANLGPPPLEAMGWLLLALIPISALFSALSLAIAAFARSSKEGQYYLMPLLLITLPLMMLPILPNIDLNMGTALIPVSGMMLLLRALIEGEYGQAARYCVPVVGVTAGCCLLAIRWAVDQFNNESVLFRESERWGLGLWLRQLVRDRDDTPTVGEALLCAVVLLIIRFFANFVGSMPTTASGMAMLVVISQVALIATPVLLMTIMLTRRPAKTLLLRMPNPLALPAAVLLAVLLHPAVIWLGEGIKMLYPMSPETIEQLAPLSKQLEEMPLLWLLPLLAFLPAICEELAFRGFILSGLRHTGHKWVAIVLSSIFFGVTHGLLQQSLAACVLGVVIGYLAVQSGSLLPGILFHVTHNSLTLLAGRLTSEMLDRPGTWGWLISREAGDELHYHWLPAVVGGLFALAILYWFRRLPYQPYAEEKLQTALDHQGNAAAVK